MKPWQALIWNEWRRMRGMFLATAEAMILLWLTLFILTMLRIRNIDTVAMLISYLLPMLLACIGFGAFQGELKSQTDSFLLALPISRSKIFWHKYLFNLSLYIVLLTLCWVLFFPLAFDKTGLANLSTTGSIISDIIVLCLCIHAMVVSATLLQNLRNSKAASWILATAFLALFIGIQAIVSLSPSNETRWLGLSVIIINIIVAFFALGMGCYLWTYYLAFKRNIMRPLFISAGVITTFAVILFTTAYIYSGQDLAAAKRDAQAAGLILEAKPTVPPTPEAKNNASRILKDLQQYQAKLNAVKPKLPSLSGINDNKYNWLSDTGYVQLPLKTMLQAADFILNDPPAVKLYADLLQTLNNPFCQFTGTSLMQKASGMRLTGIDAILFFLTDRAYALELEGKTAEAFESLELLDKLADSIDNPQHDFYEQYLFYEIKDSKYRVATRIGPDTMSGVKYYEKLLSELASMRPKFYDDTAMLLQKFPGNNVSNSEAPIKYLYGIHVFIFTPRYRESIVSFLRWQIAHKQLFEQAKTIELNAIKSAALNLAEQCSQLSFSISGIAILQIKHCYMQRTKIATMQLYLALKIYKAKHGCFPETLSELAPEILPVIPLNPISGKNFEYHADSNGLSINTNFFELLTKRSKIEITTSPNSYHTWDKNPIPAVQPMTRKTILPQGKRSGITENHETIQTINKEKAK
ncbi:MAG: ABC transporter permease [Victivallaceae bacterium]